VVRQRELQVLLLLPPLLLPMTLQNEPLIQGGVSCSRLQMQLFQLPSKAIQLGRHVLVISRAFFVADCLFQFTICVTGTCKHGHMDHGGSSNGACRSCSCTCFHTSYMCRCGSAFNQHTTGPPPPRPPPAPQQAHTSPRFASNLTIYQPIAPTVLPVIETASQRKASGRADDVDAGDCLT
jgi:hypothetical protein